MRKILTLVVIAGLLASLIVMLRLRPPGSPRDRPSDPVSSLLGTQLLAIITYPTSIRAFRTAGSFSALANGVIGFDQKSKISVDVPSPVLGRLADLLATQSTYYDGLNVKASVFTPDLVFTFRGGEREVDVFVCVRSADIKLKSAGASSAVLDVSPAKAKLENLLGPYMVKYSWERNN
jgi:hypothetical protein